MVGGSLEYIESCYRSIDWVVGNNFSEKKLEKKLGGGWVDSICIKSAFNMTGEYFLGKNWGKLIGWTEYPKSFRQNLFLLIGN